MSYSLSIPKSPSANAEIPPLFEEIPVRVLRDEALFHPGERKAHLYRIEAGTIALYWKRVGQSLDVVEFAFTGDVVGFGFLEHHIHLAKAVGEAHVRCLPLNYRAKDPHGYRLRHREYMAARRAKAKASRTLGHGPRWPNHGAS